jgi:hypothetical protein
LCVDLRSELIEYAGRVAGVVEGTAPVRRAVREERVERTLEPAGLFGADLDCAQVRVDGAVEDERSHLLRKQLGVERAEVGPVRVPHVRELLVADGLANAVHVTDRALTRDVRQQVAAAGFARLSELLELGSELGALGRSIWRIVGGEHAVEVVLTLHGARLATPARVEADDVEALRDLVRKDAGEVAGKLRSGGAGASRVHEQRADALLPIGRAHPRQRDLHRLAVVRVLVVEGHRELGAVAAVAAALPVELRRRRRPRLRR